MRAVRDLDLKSSMVIKMLDQPLCETRKSLTLTTAWDLNHSVRSGCANRTTHEKDKLDNSARINMIDSLRCKL